MFILCLLIKQAIIPRVYYALLCYISLRIKQNLGCFIPSFGTYSLYLQYTSTHCRVLMINDRIIKVFHVCVCVRVCFVRVSWLVMAAPDLLGLCASSGVGPFTGSVVRTEDG